MYEPETRNRQAGTEIIWITLMKQALTFAILILFASASLAQERGPSTNLPLPRYVSLKASKANVRRGPSKTHGIDWVFTHRGMPLQITAEHGHWRRARNQNGVGGWIYYTLLSGKRTIIVQHDMLEMKSSPMPNALVKAKLEPGVVAKIEKCEKDWCRISVERYKGWVEKKHVWGVGPDEIID